LFDYDVSGIVHESVQDSKESFIRHPYVGRNTLPEDMIPKQWTRENRRPHKWKRAAVKRIRALLVDDHALVRAGLKALLEKLDEVVVVGEAGNGHEALELIDKLRPDVVLLDLTMPGLSGFDVLKVTSEKFPEVHMIVLTVHKEE